MPPVTFREFQGNFIHFRQVHTLNVFDCFLKKPGESTHCKSRLYSSFLCFILLCFLNPVPVFSQDNQFYTKTYTTDQGLANNHVTHITQDKNGVLWIATFDGLSRFDGYEFKNYFSNPKDTNSLGVAQLDDITVDRDNNVWLMARGNFIYKFNRNNETFLNFSPELNKCSELLSQQNIAVDNEGNFWLLSSDGLIKFDPVTYKIELFPLKDKTLIPEFQWGHLSFDNRGNLWVTTVKFIYQFRDINHVKKSHGLICDAKFRFDAGQTQITSRFHFMFDYNYVYSGKRHFWIVANYGLFRLDTISGNVVKYVDKIPPGEFMDNQMVSWTDIETGLHIYYPESKKEFSINSHYEYVIESSFIDNQGNIWNSALSTVSDEGLGLQKTMAASPAFHNVLLKNKINGNNNCAVFSVSKDNKRNIWIGTRDLNYMIILTPDGSVKRGFTIPMKEHLAGVSPRSILFDSLNNVWVGYLNDLLLRYNQVTHRLDCYNRTPLFSKELPFMKSFRKLQSSSDGNLWAAGGYGFCKFNPVNNKYVCFNEFLTGNGVSFFNDEKKNETWVGMHGMVNYYKDGKFVRDIEINQSRSDISSFLICDDSTVWMALFGGGICRLNTRTFRYEQFTTSDGLPNNSTYNLCKDSKNNLWISTNKGISRLNPSTRQFWNYGISDGLFIEEFNGNAVYQDRDGEIIFGGMGGIVHFYPDSIDFHADTLKHHIMISDFRVSGFIQVFDSAVSEKSSFLLRKGQDNFSVTFACIDLKNAEKIKYRYCRAEKDTTWTYTDHKHRYLSFANLAPGDYRFIIEASDARGEWRNRKIISVTIPAYFYQMQIVRIGGLVILILLLTLWVLRLFREAKKNIEKREEALRNEVNFRGQVNPHFISNLMMSLNGLLSSGNFTGATAFLKTAYTLFRRFLDNSENDYILLRNELEILNLYVALENQGREQKITYHLVLDDKIEPEILKIVPSMIQPLMENSIIHGFQDMNGKEPVLLVRFIYENENMIICEVEDNGKGRPSTENTGTKIPRQHRSVAIENIRKRLEIHSKLSKRVYNLTYFNGEEGGTRVVIKIPAKI